MCSSVCCLRRPRVEHDRDVAPAQVHVPGDAVDRLRRAERPVARGRDRRAGADVGRVVRERLAAELQQRVRHERGLRAVLRRSRPGAPACGCTAGRVTPAGHGSSTGAAIRCVSSGIRCVVAGRNAQLARASGPGPTPRSGCSAPASRPSRPCAGARRSRPAARSSCARAPRRRSRAAGRAGRSRRRAARSTGRFGPPKHVQPLPPFSRSAASRRVACAPAASYRITWCTIPVRCGWISAPVTNASCFSFGSSRKQW